MTKVDDNFAIENTMVTPNVLPWSAWSGARVARWQVRTIELVRMARIRTRLGIRGGTAHGRAGGWTYVLGPQ
jgi:hypothetical protein